MTIYQTVLSALNRREPYGVGGALFLCSSLFFYLFRIPFPMNVDTYLYAHAIETFEGPVIHFGYYVIGAFCYSFLGPMGLTPLQTLGCMSLFFGGISVAGMYVFTFLLTENRPRSLLSAAILMFSGAFWFYSIHGEVYIPQLAFVLLSLICLWKKRPLLSGLSILIAVSITPTSLLALVPSCYLMYMRRFNRKHVMMFAAPLLSGCAIAMAWDGPGIIDAFQKAIHPPTVFVDPFSITRLLTLLAYQLMRAYGNAFNLICLFALLGFLFLLRDNRRLWGLMLAFILPFSAYLLNQGLVSADHLIITFIAVSFWGAYGVLKLFDRFHVKRGTRILYISLLVVFHALITYERSISRQTAYAAEMDRVVHALAEKYDPNGILLTDFDFGVIFFSMLGKEFPYSILKGNPDEYRMTQQSSGKDATKILKSAFWIEFTRLLDIASWPDFWPIVDERPVYFTERQFWPIGMIQLYMPLRETFGIVDRNDPERLEHIHEYLAYKLEADVRIRKMVDSPLYPVYVMKALKRTK